MGLSRDKPIRKIEPTSEPTADAPIRKPNLSGPRPRTIRTYNGIITVMIGKIQKDCVAMRTIIARLGGSFATKRKPSLIPLVRFSSSWTVPLRRGGQKGNGNINAEKKNPVGKKKKKKTPGENKKTPDPGAGNPESTENQGTSE